jgi:dTDP-L-rhamnose 4-epimerase
MFIKEKMKILITGGAGFIGSKLIKKLFNHEIIVLDNFLEQIHGKNPNFIEGVNYINGDVRNINDWEIALNHNPDIIFHLASETGTGQSMDEINRYVTTNIVGTSIMLDMVNTYNYNVKKIILSSSRAVYGDSENIETNFNLNPKSVYGVTKLTQEMLIKTSCKIPYTILRLQNVYGDGQSLNNPYTGIISIFSNLLKYNKDINIFDNGLPTRDFIYVDDVVDAMLLCVENNISDNKIYNVGTGESLPIINLTKKLKKELSSNSKIIVSDFHRDGDIIHANGNIELIKKELSWVPKSSLDIGIKNFINWFSKNSF